MVATIHLIGKLISAITPRTNVAQRLTSTHGDNMREAKRTSTGRFQYVNTPAEIGKRFGRLLVLERSGTSKWGDIIFRCRCDCGNETRSWSTTLSDGTSKSCGCLNREKVVRSATRHGNSPRKKATPEYNSWAAMMSRCRNSRSPEFRYYGGRGITICERWLDFKNFLSDMGQRPAKTTLDRIKVNLNYEPSNCRWATKETQSNNRRCNVLIEYLGKIQSVAQWSRQTGLKRITILGRIARGWSVERTLTAPLQRKTT